MQWFYDMRVGNKLVISFLVMAALTAVVGLLGINSMKTINGLAESMYSRELMGLSAIKDANITLIYIDRASKNMLLASTLEERVKYASRIGQYHFCPAKPAGIAD